MNNFHHNWCGQRSMLQQESRWEKMIRRISEGVMGYCIVIRCAVTLQLNDNLMTIE